MNNIKQKKNDILQIFAHLTRYPVIQNVMEHKVESSCSHCSSCHYSCGSIALNEGSSLSHIVFQQQDNKKDTCSSYCNQKNNKPVLMPSYNSCFSKTSNANKLVNSAKQHWTRNKIKMVQAAAAVITLIVLTFCLLFQPGASPHEENHPSWSSGAFKSANIIENNIRGFPSSPSIASRFGLVARERNTQLPVDDIKQEDLFISVKTSQKFHQKRLDLVLKTWFQLARDQTWFFTDQHDPEIEERTSKFHFLFFLISFVLILDNSRLL